MSLLPTVPPWFWHRKSCSRVKLLCLWVLGPRNTPNCKEELQLVQCVGARRGRWGLERGLCVYVVFPKPEKFLSMNYGRRGDISTPFLVQWGSLKASPENKRRKPVDRSLEWGKEGRERNLRNGSSEGRLQPLSNEGGKDGFVKRQGFQDRRTEKQAGGMRS